MSRRYCCICYDPGVRCKGFLARHLKKVTGLTEYQGMIKGLDLCKDCVVHYHTLAEEGLMPVTLIEDRDAALSQYIWTQTTDIMAAQMDAVRASDFVQASEVLAHCRDSRCSEDLLPVRPVGPAFYDLSPEDRTVIAAEQRRHSL